MEIKTNSTDKKDHSNSNHFPMADYHRGYIVTVEDSHEWNVENYDLTSESTKNRYNYSHYISHNDGFLDFFFYELNNAESDALTFYNRINQVKPGTGFTGDVYISKIVPYKKKKS